MVNANLLELINSSVTIGLKSADLPDTPHNRIMILSGMYQSLLHGGMKHPSEASFIPILEEEIVRLTDLESK